jgi:uncharacterized protein (TIGR03435 family)
MRALPFICLLAFALGIAAQQPRQLDVASVRRHEGTGFKGSQGFFDLNQDSFNRRVSGNRVAEPRCTLIKLISDAYKIRMDRISGGPRWAQEDGEVYDVLAQADGDDTLKPDEARLLLRDLLADRFQLKLRHETKDADAYVLAIAKNGLKVKMLGAPTRLGFTDLQLMLASIALKLEAPLIDKTGLTGEMDFSTVNYRELMADSASLATELEGQLGLHLERTKVPSEFLLIKHAERPSEN